MNRLDAMILRMTTQRAGLDWAMSQIKDRAGDALEIGLGNGRTYDHMREHMPRRRIWAIERKLQAHPSSMPPAEDVLVGDAAEGLKRLEGAGIVLANYDLGSGKVGTLASDVPDERAATMTPLLVETLSPHGAIVVSTQRLAEHPKLALHPVTDEISRGRVFIYERVG